MSVSVDASGDDTVHAFSWKLTMTSSGLESKAGIQATINLGFSLDSEKGELFVGLTAFYFETLCQGDRSNYIRRSCQIL
jgi:hypothetical protein